MNAEHLRHILRAAATVTGEKVFVVIGSQSILGSHPDAPRSLRKSVEGDTYPKNHPEKAIEVDGAICSSSAFPWRPLRTRLTNDELRLLISELPQRLFFLFQIHNLSRQFIPAKRSGDGSTPLILPLLTALPPLRSGHARKAPLFSVLLRAACAFCSLGTSHFSLGTSHSALLTRHFSLGTSFSALL
jgi:hypothetical protein